MADFLTHLKALAAALDRGIWGILTQDKDGRISETERALSTVRGFATLGLVAVALFGWIASPANGSLRGAATALLTAMAAFGAGGLMGFLFGLPRWTPDSTPGKTGAAAGETSTSGGAIIHNTNLHRVIEWLTTLIVGLGLVHLKDAIRYGTTTSRWLTGEIVAPKDPMSVESGTPGAAILITYAIAGFFMVFLWTVRYMGREIREADTDMQQIQRQLVQTKTQLNSIVAAATPAPAPQQPGGMALAPPQAAAGFQAESINGLAKHGIDPAIVDDLNQRYSRATRYTDEPLEGFGKSEDSTTARRIEASVAEIGPGLALFEVTLRVVSTAPQKPLAGEVIFLLHHTLSPLARVVLTHNGVAELKVPCIGSFVAGALVTGERTKLSLDLTTVPGATREFIEG